MMMCCVYGISKVSETEIKFKDIVKAYSTLQCALPQVRQLVVWVNSVQLNHTEY